MSCASGFGAGEVERVKGPEAALLQCQRPLFYAVRERDVLCGQAKAFLNPLLAQGKWIAVVFQIVNRGVNQRRLARFNQRQHETERKSFEPDARLALVVERTV